MINYTVRTNEDGTAMLNDNGTVQVEINVDGKTVNQDFAVDTLDDDVKTAIVILRRELANAPVQPDYTPPEGSVTVLVKDLPTIPEEDFQEEQPEVS